MAEKDADRLKRRILRSGIWAPLMRWPPLCLSAPGEATELVLHIGLHKTATSSVQRFLNRNRMRLARRGVHVPRLGLHPGHHGLASPAPPANAELPGGLDQTLDRLSRRYAGSGRRIILSTENLSLMSRDRIPYAELAHRLRHFERIRVVVVLRAQTVLLQSIYAQVAKEGKAVEPADMVRNALTQSRHYGVRLDYTELHRDLLTGFDDDQIDFLDYDALKGDRKSPPEGILRAMGVPDDLAETARHIHVNKSPEPLALWLCAAGKRRRPRRARIERCEQALRDRFGEAMRTSIYTRSEYAALKAHFAPLNAAFQDRLGRDGHDGYEPLNLDLGGTAVFRDDIPATMRAQVW